MVSLSEKDCVNGDVFLLTGSPGAFEVTVRHLECAGYRVDSAAVVDPPPEGLVERQFDVALVQTNGNPQETLLRCRAMKELHPELEVILVSEKPIPDADLADVQEYIYDTARTWDLGGILRAVRNAGEREKLLQQNRVLLTEIRGRQRNLAEDATTAKRSMHRHLSTTENLIGEHDSMVRVRHEIAEVAPTEITVLIRGESGTGKDVVARLIHDWSGRALRGRFVKINCPSIAESLLESELFGHEKGAFTGAVRAKPGRFELAAEGTLFLDEIGSISGAVQGKLLQAVEQKQFSRLGDTRSIEVDARVVAATNADLEEMIDREAFRADLFYRLQQFVIGLPPLRERVADIPMLAEHFLREHLAKYGDKDLRIPHELMDEMMAYAWPGNVRELQSAIRRYAIKGHPRALIDAIAPSNGKRKGVEGGKRLVENELRLIVETLNETNWNQRKTAQLLGISYSTLRRRITHFEIRRVATAYPGINGCSGE